MLLGIYPFINYLSTYYNMGGIMNNNFYEIPNDWYNEFNNTFNTLNTYKPNMYNKMNNYPSLANPKEALDRGNLFNGLYDPYKNYRYRELRPKNKKEELLSNVMKYKFVLKELDLYLDTHPLDEEMIRLYNNYQMEEKKACDEFEKSFGPLTLDSEYLKGNNWKWLENNWPWEGTK